MNVIIRRLEKILNTVGEQMEKTEKNKISFTEGSVFASLIRFALPVLGALILDRKSVV